MAGRSGVEEVFPFSSPNFALGRNAQRGPSSIIGEVKNPQEGQGKGIKAKRHPGSGKPVWGPALLHALSSESDTRTRGQTCTS